ncbi:hypothetical protein B0H63DRAFT_39748 [Podospora didyma]|uniref:Uncharacterized protein n=1 Tax=Podospora didyma TaxID=330526 RepID=A0AAE0U8B9_9PEZI|nr:hypothetical protein B0H63DRAFT_39748 [Podospora didyma]
MAAVAPMDLVIKTDLASIPLRCTLCPKKPSFSDVSHLLTHISSKSHLSHRFKTELRSHTEDEAGEEIRLFDDWYNRHGIRNLLAGRMAAKEQKSSRRGRLSNTVTKVRSTAARADSIKAEPEEFIASTPLISPWPQASLSSQNMREGYFDNSGYQTPIVKRTRSAYSIPDTPDHDHLQVKYQRFPSESETTASAVASELPSDHNEMADEDNDSSKLKGIKYPGMGLFDSASELQKRKRNQRKDESVLAQMKNTSSGIEPTEFVWSEDGDLQRTRDIYASPSIEGSPERVLRETDNHKKKKRNRRAPANATASRPRQVRSSARIAQNKANNKIKTDHDEDSSFDHEDNNHSQVSSHSHGSMDSYDVFRDPPHTTPDSNNLSPLEQSGFELRRRPALHSLSANMPIMSPASKHMKPNPYFSARDNGSASYPSHATVPGNHYYQHRQNSMNGGNFNPLCVQPTGAYFNPYYQAYGNDHKPSTQGFQPINTMSQSLGVMPYSAFATPYATDPMHEHVHTEF